MKNNRDDLLAPFGQIRPLEFFTSHIVIQSLPLHRVNDGQF